MDSCEKEEGGEESWETFCADWMSGDDCRPISILKCIVSTGTDAIFEVTESWLAECFQVVGKNDVEVYKLRGSSFGMLTLVKLNKMFDRINIKSFYILYKVD